MNRLIVISLVSLLVNACASQASLFIMQNRQNLTRLTYGMTKEQVTAIMGTESVGSRNNPYRSAMYLAKDNKPTEVWYYWTDDDHRGRGIRDDELTPVVFTDGREGTNIVLIDPDLHGLFPDSKAVNLALLGCVSAKANRNLALPDQRGKAARLKREV